MSLFDTNFNFAIVQIIDYESGVKQDVYVPLKGEDLEELKEKGRVLVEMSNGVEFLLDFGFIPEKDS
jgi:Cu/Ag efflux pump CusA